MTRLSELPQVAAEPVAATVEWNGTEYAFSVQQIPFSKAQVFNPTLDDGQDRNVRILSELVLFEDDTGSLVPLEYNVAASLPPALAVLISNKAWQLNGYGIDPAKN